MKCFSTCQPWATLIAVGAKSIETRSWQTSHRGLVGIHASSNFTPAARYLCSQEPFRSVLAGAGYDDWCKLPTGVIVGTAHIVGVRHVGELTITSLEGDFGDFRPGQ